MIMESGQHKDFGSMRVESFAISHDAAEPVGYNFYDGKEKLCVATDLGYVSDKVRDAISDADVLVLEANHDIELLRMGRYPWNTKRRILGDMGHLSNEAAGAALSENSYRADQTDLFGAFKPGSQYDGFGKNVGTRRNGGSGLFFQR